MAKIFVIDLWLKNSDRQPYNLNMILANQKLYAIDHAATFDQISFIDLAKPVLKEYFVQPGEIGELIVSSHFFRYYYNRYAQKLEEAGRNLCREIEATDKPLINRILRTLPEGWCITEDEKNAVIDYLIFRKATLSNLFIEHLNFSR